MHSIIVPGQIRDKYSTSLFIPEPAHSEASLKCKKHMLHFCLTFQNLDSMSPLTIYSTALEMNTGNWGTMRLHSC